MNKEGALIDIWSKDPAACSFEGYDFSKVLREIDRRLVGAWEKNQENEREMLLSMREALLAYEQKERLNAELLLESQPLAKSAKGILCFAGLSQAVNFIAACLERNDPQRLHENMANTRQIAQTDLLIFREFVFAQLQKRHEEIDLRSRYRQLHFPAGENRFKLGGHMAELGCIHIDFVKTDEGWLLDSITICR